MALLALYDDLLELDEIRLALYGAKDARASATGGGSGAVVDVTPKGAIVNEDQGGSISTEQSGGTVL